MTRANLLKKRTLPIIPSCGQIEVEQDPEKGETDRYQKVDQKIEFGVSREALGQFEIIDKESGNPHLEIFINYIYLTKASFIPFIFEIPSFAGSVPPTPGGPRRSKRR